MQKSRRFISRDKNLEAEATKECMAARIGASQKTLFMNTIYPARQLSLTFEFWVYLDLPEMLRTEEHCNSLK